MEISQRRESEIARPDFMRLNTEISDPKCLKNFLLKIKFSIKKGNFEHFLNIKALPKYDRDALD